jgi:hypothetical protein
MGFSLENGAEQSVCFRGSSCADSNLEMVEMRASLAAFSTSPRLQHHGKSLGDVFNQDIERFNRRRINVFGFIVD